MHTSQGDSTHDDYIFKIPALKPVKSSGAAGSEKKEFLMGADKESPYFHKKALSPKYSPVAKLDIGGAKSKLGLFREPTFDQMPSIGFKLQSERVKATSIGNIEPQVKSTNQIGVLYSHRNFESEAKQNGNNESTPKKNVNPLQSNFENFVNRFSKVQTSTTLPNPEPIQHSLKSNGLIKAFAVCTNQGLVRNYNEDRITTMVNIVKPMNKYFNEKWPNCSIFGIFDGHGGARCADFLKDNLHHYIVKSPYFPLQPVEALKEACSEADKDFSEIALAVAKDSEDGKHDRSGSCGLILLTIDNKCYVCNIGDSRAVLSRNMGTIKSVLTRDHKPSDEQEKKRIFEAGGKIYQSVPVKKNNETNGLNIPIPYRISPGRLAISRAFGDIEAKMPRFGGNPNVLVSHPEITSFIVDSDYDFLVLGCDGIFDVLSNDEVIDIAWNSINKKKSQNIHEAMKAISEEIVRQSMLKKSLDNVTALVVCFSSLDFKFLPSPTPSHKQPSQKDNNVKLPAKWEYTGSFQDDERVVTPKKGQPKGLKQIFKGRSHPLPGEDGSPLDESPKLKPLTPHKPIVSGTTGWTFEKWEQNRQSAENDVVTFKGLPRISKIRTPR